jgi:hypothetical protein
VPFRQTDLEAQQSFYLLTNNFLPPVIPDFKAHKLWQILDCLDEPLQIQEAIGSQPQPPCEPVVHRWTLVQYRQID